MHLLRAQAGVQLPSDSIADLQQTPAEIVILCTGDSQLSLLAQVARQLPEDYPSVRLANPAQLRNHASVDFYVEQVLQHAQLIFVAVHGGLSYWRYGIERILELGACGKKVALMSGDDTSDPELMALSNMGTEATERLWQFLRQGGEGNARNLFFYLGQKGFSRTYDWQEPSPLPRALVYHPRRSSASLSDWQRGWNAQWPVVAILFYRTHVQSANTDFIAALCEVLQAQQLNPLPLAVASLKEQGCMAQIEAWMAESQTALIINTTGFAQSSSECLYERPFKRPVPVLQAVCALDSLEQWQGHPQGLGARDLAMHVVLPELDGRLITRPISFKGLAWRSERTQSDVVCYQPHVAGMRFVAELAQRWIALARLPNGEKRIALVLANYPTRDGRIGNGVGLDTPAAALNILKALEKEGYPVADLPESGTALIHRLLGGVTNDLDQRDLRPCSQSLAMAEYRAFFRSLPEANQQAVLARWGEPEQDPMCRSGRMMVAGLRFGLTFVGIQPARGYQLDASAVYHDPDLVPPHGYLAFYAWIRQTFGAQALVHVGKHGNLEWLPGKSVGLSPECWPDALLGPMPNIYPFIVNDPGEGAQAKRRTQAVIIDHLMPPLTRAENYGPLRDLERLADEYYQASQLDPRRAVALRDEILKVVQETHLDRELGFTLNEDPDSWLPTLDAYLCDLKESQIRDGLHVFGQSPEGRLRRDTLLALVRIPRQEGKGQHASLLRALSQDLNLNFDPLNSDLSAPWLGERPECLALQTEDLWRTTGDTRERLELLALSLIQQLEDGQPVSTVGPESHAVLHSIQSNIAPLLDRCGAAEMQGLLDALAGRFVPAGPSGAPSRGRLDVLPTGRNFYTVDVRHLPTPTAWRIGVQSADQLLERHLQDQGDHLRQLGLSVWGTATMRTGGDDIAQALALLGVRPVWQGGSQRVEGFEILPLEVLGRPRVDVTLRVSGFFRDAFGHLIRLFDEAVQAVADLDEPEDLNPLSARVWLEALRLEKEQGLNELEARQQAGWRVFGSKPGAYGAGLQNAIEERLWQERQDLAELYLNWSGYAYGKQAEGLPARERLVERLEALEAVLHNQDNREHDLLDSNDYYQFQGGMLAAVETLKGLSVASYHGDTSQPDAPKIRTLKEELGRVVRSRAVNPKWIEGMKRHGYKGAFELAATLDYLFAFDATTHLIEDYQYALLAEAYLLDSSTRDFIQQHNPGALQDMLERLLEAQQRGLWEKPEQYQSLLENLLLDAEES